jgi:hypothetical protein
MFVSLLRYRGILICDNRIQWWDFVMSHRVQWQLEIPWPMEHKSINVVITYATMNCCRTHEELLSELTLVDATTRERLVQIIPTNVQGETCIGCGLRLALQVRCLIRHEMLMITLYHCLIASLFTIRCWERGMASWSWWQMDKTQNHINLSVTFRLTL